MCLIYMISIAFVSSDFLVTVVTIQNLTFLSKCFIWIFLLSFLDLFYLPIVGVEGYCCTRSHSVAHPHTHICLCVHACMVELPCLWDWPFAEASTSTAHIIHKRQRSMLLAGFELTIPASEQPQTYTLGGTATDIWIFFIDILICFV